MDPITIGLGLGAIGGTLSSIFGGGGDSGGGQQLQLPPELMLDLINRSQASLTAMNQDRQKLSTMYDTFSKQLDIIQQQAAGTMPSEEAVKQSQELMLDMARRVGMSAKELSENGLMTEESAKYLTGLEEERQAREAERKNLEQERQGLLGKIGAESEDPELIRKQQEQRAQLQQELMRSGASPSMIQRALADFDQSSREERYNQAKNEFEQGAAAWQLGSQNLGAGMGIYQGGLNLFGQRTGAEYQGFQNLLGAQTGAQSTYESLFSGRMSGLNSQTSLGAMRYNLGESYLAGQAGYRQEAKYDSPKLYLIAPKDV